MLKQASVSDLITDRVSRGRKSYVVIAMRRYPRFINRELRDEYLPSLASDTKLFEDWLTTKRKSGDHDGAYFKVDFEGRFRLDEEGLANLERLTEMSKKKDVYLVCQCATGLRCHREMVLLVAKHLFGAKIEEPKNEYGLLEKKLREHPKQILAPPKEEKARAGLRTSVRSAKTASPRKKASRS